MTRFVDFFMPSHYLASIAPGSVQETERGISVRALAFVDGKQKPIKGRSSTKTAKQLNEYAGNSNKWLDSGREIPFFESPHDLKGSYSNEDKIGTLGQFSTTTITKEDIPSDRFSDLIGKTGAFTTVEITRDDAIEKYKKGLIKEISVGLGDIGEGPQFFEASAVPWGAVRGAQLFGHPMIARSEEEEADNGDGDTSTPGRYALTMAGAMAEKDSYEAPGMNGVSRLSRQLREVIAAIQTTDESELLGRDRQQLMNSAVNDFARELRKELNLTAPTPPTVPVTGETFMFNYSRSLPEIEADLKTGGESVKPEIKALSELADLSPEQFTAAFNRSTAQEIEHYGLVVGAIAKKMSPSETSQLTPEIEQRFSLLEGQLSSAKQKADASEKELFAMKQRQQVGDRYMSLKTRAAKLNADGKLSAHAYRTYFPDGEQFSVAVERFSLAPTVEVKEGEAAPTTLDQVEATLSYLEQFGQSVPTGSVAGKDPIEQPNAMGDQERKDTERYILNHPDMSEEEKQRELKKLEQPAA